MYQRKWSSEAQREELTDERKDKVFLESVNYKYNPYNNYSKLGSPVAINA